MTRLMAIAAAVAGVALLLAWWQWQAAQDARQRARDAEARVAVQMRTIEELQAFTRRQRVIDDQHAAAVDDINKAEGGDAPVSDYLLGRIGRVQSGAGSSDPE